MPQLTHFVETAPAMAASILLLLRHFDSEVSPSQAEKPTDAPSDRDLAGVRFQ